MLSIDAEKKGGEDEVSSDDEETIVDAAETLKNHQKAQSKRRPATKNGNRDKRSQKPKAEDSSKEEASVPDMPALPIESFRIIDYDSSMVIDYMMAVYSLAHQMRQLPHHWNLRYDITGSRILSQLHLDSSTESGLIMLVSIFIESAASVTKRGMCYS